MELQMNIPSPAVDFDFNVGRCSSPCLSTPSTPRAFGSEFYFSAPTSPAHASQIYRESEGFTVVFNAVPGNGPTSSSPSPHRFVETGTHSCCFLQGAKEVNEVGFDMQREGESSFSFPTHEINAEPKIPPTMASTKIPSTVASTKIPSTVASTKIPSTMASPRSHHVKEMDVASSLNTVLLSPLSPKSSKSEGKKHFWSTLLPKKRKDKALITGQEERGRQRDFTSSTTSVSDRRAARSLSPVRVSKYPWEEEEQHQLHKTWKYALNPKPSSSPSKESLASSSKTSRRWRLKDFLLFRSASEGRTSDKDPFKKYATLHRKHKDDKISTYYQPASPPPASRRRGHVSAHEMHYTFNEAVSDDLKRKTFLPYKKGILGRLAVNPTVHLLANASGH